MGTTTIQNPREVVLGSMDGAESYFTDMVRMQLEHNIRRIFVEGNDVCVLYDLLIEDEKIFCCGWYTVKNGKISNLKVVLDPRPLLEAQG